MAWLSFARFTAAAVLALAAGPTGAQQENDAAAPPNVVKDPTYVVPGDAALDPTTYDSFETWLTERGSVPGIATGGFLARELLGRPLYARSGDELGQVQNIALDEQAVARFLLVRLGDDALRAVPVGSLIVDNEDRLLTEMTTAQVQELPGVGG
jgi:hypothetical protein